MGDAEPVDVVLSKAGFVGTIQLSVHISVFYVLLVVSSQISAIFFTGHSPPWKCVTNSTSGFCNINRNATFSKDSDLFNQRCSLSRGEWIYITKPSYSFVTEYDLVCSKKTAAALIGVVYYVGTVVGAFFGGPLVTCGAGNISS